MTMIDRERLEGLKARLKDKYSAVELCELLGLTEDDLLEQFEEQVMEIDWDDE